MPTLTAAPEPGNSPPRVLLTLDMSDVSPVPASATVSRLDPDGRTRAVRLAEPAKLTGGQWTGYDYETPFGQPVTYTAVAGSTSVAGAPVTLDVSTVWLRHPGVPSLSMPLPRQAPSTLATRRRASTRGVFRPLGRSTPLVVTEGTRQAPETALVVKTSSLDEMRRLWDLLADESVLLLTLPAGLGWGVTHEYISVGDVEESRVAGWGGYEPRVFMLPYTVVDRPAGGLQSQWTWGDVLARFASWSEVLAFYPSWQDVLTNRGTVTPAPAPEPEEPTPVGTVPLAPANVMAVQGPTDPADLYVWVTWERTDRTADAYEVLRDGAPIGTVTVSGTTWDKCAFKDATVARGAYSYSVRALTAGVRSDASPGASVQVRVNTPANVYTPASTSRADVQAAINSAASAALAAGSDVKVVQLAASTTYSIDVPLTLAASNVVLRGAGGTVLRATFTGDAANGSNAPGLLQVDGGTAAVTLSLTADVPAGSRTVPVTDASGVSVGDWLLLNQTVEGAPGTVATTTGVRMDPGAGWSDAKAFEIQQVTATTATSVTFAQPIGSDFTAARSLTASRLTGAVGCGLEKVTLEGPSTTNTNYLSGLRLFAAPRFTVADVTARLFTRAQVDMRDAPLCTFVGLTIGNQTDLANADTPGIYAVNAGRSPDMHFVACTFGSDTSSVNARSFITWNRAHRSVIRHCTFGQTKSYCVNEHGFASRRIRVENSRFTPGPDHKFAAVFVGNEDFGFAGDMLVKNNLQEGGSCFVRGRENSFGMRVLDNLVRNLVIGSVVTTPAVVEVERTWAGPDTEAALYGSVRWVIRRNQTVNCAGNAVRLAQTASTVYPFNGIRDVLIGSDNDWSGTAGTALVVPATTSGPVTVIDTFNSGITGWTSAHTLAHSTTDTHEGGGKLTVTRTFTTGFSNARVNSPVQSVKDKRAQGDTVGCWVKVPSTASGTNWVARIQIQNSAGTFQGPAEFTKVPKGLWVFVSWKPGDAILTDVNRHSIEPASASGNLTADETVTLGVDTYEQANDLRASAIVERVGADVFGSWTSETF